MSTLLIMTSTKDVLMTREWRPSQPTVKGLRSWSLKLVYASMQRIVEKIMLIITMRGKNDIQEGGRIGSPSITAHNHPNQVIMPRP